MSNRACLNALRRLTGIAALAVSGVSGAETLVLQFDRSITQAQLADRGAPGLGVGDQRLFTATLTDPASGTVRGTDRGFCAVVAGAGLPTSHRLESCRQSLQLGSDQLEVQGYFDATAYESGSTQVLAVTGGAGAYRAAHGQATFERTGTTTSRLTVTLHLDAASSPPSSRSFTQRVQTLLQLDRGLPGRTAGDETLYSAEILAPAGGRLGTNAAFCMTVTDGNLPGVGPFLAQCQLNLALGDGQIVVEGLLDESAFDANQPQTLPVVGGTGAYATAHGHLTITRTAADRAALSLSLDPQGGCVAGSRTFIEQGTQFYQVEDGRPERSAGDILTSASELIEIPSLVRAGTSHAYFLTVADGPGPPFIAQASQSLVLAEGRVNFGGVFSQTDFEAFVPAVFPVNGGAGAYRSAHGIATVQQLTFATFELTMDIECDEGREFRFDGFRPPVDNPPALNSMNAGRTVPVKFSLGGDFGPGIFAEGYPASREIACYSLEYVDELEETESPGASGLSYDAAEDQYTYKWQTLSGWEGTCRQLVVQFVDGTTRRANFSFR